MPSTSSSRAEPRTQAEELARLDRIANTMDAAFRVPGLGLRIGWDSILGLIPGVGDAVALTPAAYIVWRARALGAPNPLLVRMSANIAADALIGTIPLLGDLFDVALKANRKNVALLRRHLDEIGPGVAPGPAMSEPVRPVQPTSSRPEKK